MKRNVIGTILVIVILASIALAFLALRPQMGPTAMPGMESTPTMAGMSRMDMPDAAIPSVQGYTEGVEIHFIHTEASDPQVAQMLTDMMGGSPVLVVQSLAQAPETMLAKVYVFTNGVRGVGPFGFQPDVFDNPPGTEGYSPLRTVNLVAWQDEQAARVLKSAAEVIAAESQGEISIERPEVVVNMPMLTWPGGQR